MKSPEKTRDVENELMIPGSENNTDENYKKDKAIPYRHQKTDGNGKLQVSRGDRQSRKSLSLRQDPFDFIAEGSERCLTRKRQEEDATNEKRENTIQNVSTHARTRPTSSSAAKRNGNGCKRYHSYSSKFGEPYVNIWQPFCREITLRRYPQPSLRLASSGPPPD